MATVHDYTTRTEYRSVAARMKAGHRVLLDVPFEPSLPEHGYTNRTLYINLTELQVAEKPVTQQMKDTFVGGRGFGLWYLWNAISPTTKWDDPENEIVISPGPLAGNTQYAGSGKSLVVTLSPLTGIPIDNNVGGYYGPLLKFCGFDALELQGKAAADVVIVIDHARKRITIEEAPDEPSDSHMAAEVFTHEYADGEQDLVNVSVVSAGRGADHSLLGCLNFSWWDPRRRAVRLKQAGRGGTGHVFRDKRLKALVVRGPKIRSDMNHAAEFDRTVRVGRSIQKEIHDFDDEQNRMRRLGTAHLFEVMNAYDLLPVWNFQYGSHPDGVKMGSAVWEERFTQGVPDACWYGCGLSCCKGADGHVVRTGPYRGHVVTVDGPEYENGGGIGSNCGVFDPDWILELNFYCDTYGIDTISFASSAAFAMECYQRGILNADRTGELDLAWGNAEAELELLHQIARGEGFGMIVGLGVKRMQELFAARGWGDRQFLRDIGMQIKGLEISQYMSKESLAQQGGYALANKGPQHDEAWLIFMDMVNHQIPSFEDKAEALHYFPLFRTWFSLMGLCKLPWNDIEPADNALTREPAKVPKHVENYLELYSGITGQPLTTEGLLLQSERVYNFQRVFNLRMGHGRRADDMPPYRAVGPVTAEEYESRVDRYDQQLREVVGIEPAGLSTEEKLRRLRRYREARFEQLVNAVYARRGWTTDGVPTLETLERLGIALPEVVDVVRSSMPGTDSTAHASTPGERLS